MGVGADVKSAWEKQSRLAGFIPLCEDEPPAVRVKHMVELNRSAVVRNRGAVSAVEMVARLPGPAA